MTLMRRFHELSSVSCRYLLEQTQPFKKHLICKWKNVKWSGKRSWRFLTWSDQSFFSSSVSSSDCAPFCMSFSSVEEEGRTSCSTSSVFLLVLSCTNSWISNGSRRNLSWYSWSRSFWSCEHRAKYYSLQENKTDHYCTLL